MPGYKDLQGVYEQQRKKGLATLVVDLVGYPNDQDFDRNAPVAKVTIQPSDPSDPAAVFASEFKELSRSTSREDRSFVVQVETVPGRFKRLFRKEQPRTLTVSIRVEPVGVWADFYHATDRTIPVTPGKATPVSVDLKPKYTHSRLDRPATLDKPRAKLPPTG